MSHNLLRPLQAYEKRRWSEHLPELLMIYNATSHDSTSYSPYYLMFGGKSQLPKDFMLNLASEDKIDVDHLLKEHLDQLSEAYVRAELKLKRQAAVRKETYDKLPHSVPLQVGGKVKKRIHHSERANIQERHVS